eukprot:5196701-Prymnesium_polylepis.2
MGLLGSWSCPCKLPTGCASSIPVASLTATSSAPTSCSTQAVPEPRKVADFGISRAQDPEDTYREMMHAADGSVPAVAKGSDHQQLMDRKISSSKMSSCKMSSSKMSSVGTLRYTAPRPSGDAAGQDGRPRVDRFADDIYAFGLLLYEVLHGELICACRLNRNRGRMPWA